VAGARFFHFMVELFIKHVLGVGSKHSGFYGDTKTYDTMAQWSNKDVSHFICICCYGSKDVFHLRKSEIE
jgi:hypothetical protein